MNAAVWLISIASGAALVLWVVAGVIDALAERREVPRVVQPVRAWPAPPPWSRGELFRARQARAARARRRQLAAKDVVR
ncbi:hypothetical protein ACIQJT_02290 [Streptomyces sp. NPDC091972]|uniref:hypothetical protein n=1 Tax=Streptomyces sp. NPDC091972 TaxID=3366007 RepID=UPI00382C58B0